MSSTQLTDHLRRRLRISGAGSCRLLGADPFRHLGGSWFRFSRTGERSRSSSLASLIFALFFVSGLAQTALVPLLPRLSAAYGLSDTSAAFVLALPGLAMLGVSVPAGLLADRFGARRVTLASAVLLVIGCVGQATPGLAALLVGRIVYGISFGALWTAGAAWLSELGDGPGRVGPAVVCSSVGTMVGPALGGLVGAGAAATAPATAPFAAIAGIGVLVALALAAAPWLATRRAARDAIALVPAPPPAFVAELSLAGAEGGSPGAGPTSIAAGPAAAGAERAAAVEPVSTGSPAFGSPPAVAPPPDFVPRLDLAPVAATPPPGRALLGLATDRWVAAGIGALVVAGALSGVTQLLIADGLHADHVSSGSIGLAFSTCAVGYIIASAAFVRLGRRAHTLQVNLIVTALAALALLPALVSGSAWVLVGALLLTAAPRGAINVVAYGVAGRTGDGVAGAGGAVFGLLNGAWGAATVAMPLAAGALAQTAGPRLAYLAVIVPSLMVSGLLIGGLLPAGTIRRLLPRIHVARGARSLTVTLAAGSVARVRTDPPTPTEPVTATSL